jgi:hypothetical protein
MEGRRGIWICFSHRQRTSTSTAWLLVGSHFLYPSPPTHTHTHHQVAPQKGPRSEGVNGNHQPAPPLAAPALVHWYGVCH